MLVVVHENQLVLTVDQDISLLQVPVCDPAPAQTIDHATPAPGEL